MTFVAPNLACGEARGGRIPFPGAVTDEQRCHRPNSAQPAGRQVFFAHTSLLAPSQPAAGMLRRSRLVWSKNPSPRTSSYLCLRPPKLGRIPGKSAPSPSLLPHHSNAVQPRMDSDGHGLRGAITGPVFTTGFRYGTDGPAKGCLQGNYP